MRNKLICFFLVILWTLVTCDDVNSRFSYNSSDLSYLSNGIQFPVPDATSESSQLVEEVVADNLTDIKFLANLYDHLKWDKYLKALNNTQCRSDMATYIRELNNGTSWATKMYDSSGRYSGQFFFGNDYWLGSKTFCDELVNPLTNTEIPPFPIYFSVSKVRININRQLTPVTRQLNVGECLPASCNLDDVRVLFVQERKSGVSINIVGMRKVPGQYNVLDDIKFQIVGGIGVVTGLLVFIASLVEIFMKRNSRDLIDDAELENNNNNSNQSVNDVKCSKDPVVRKSNKQRQGLGLRLLLSFSAINNGKKILNVEKPSSDSIQCIHGLRFFSIAWIILVHTYLEVFSISDNKSLRVITERSFMYQAVANATFSVDTFFFISGLLVTLTYFRLDAKKVKKDAVPCEVAKATIIKFILLLVYRFLRLTPAYLFVLGVNEVILRFLHSFSVFSPAIIDHISCSNFWWRNALYINNFYPQSEFCMLWSWYIANDTQFYLLASILLIIAVRGKNYLKFAGIALGIFMIASWILTFIIAMRYEYVVRVEEPFALFDQLYDKPWMRIGPYFIGIMAGYFLFRVNCKVRLTPIVITIGWVLSLSVLASLVFGVGKKGLHLPISAIYASLGHTAWGLALAWITIACCSGYGGPLASLFNMRLFLPLSRLTYCAYLIHPVLMCLSSFILDGPLHLQQEFLFVIYSGNLIFSFLSAFVISLAFEAPIVNLLKIIF